MKKFSLIVCINNKNVIGNDNDLLYHIKEDLQNFKRMTTNNVVIMGRKTYESLPKRPLPNRFNIVITRDLTYKVDGDNVVIVNSVEDAVKLCEESFNDIECFVIGGGQIYNEFLNKDYISRMYITEVLDNTEGNVVFPIIKLDEWKLFYESSYQINSSEHDFKFKIYDKNRN